MSTGRYRIVVVAAALSLFLASDGAGNADAGDVSCPDRFRRQPTISRDLFVDRLVEEDFVRRVTAHADYWHKPYMRDFDDGRMDRTARFKMMIDDATPLSEEYGFNSRIPSSYEHFSIFVEAGNERPVWVLLWPVSEAGWETPRMVALGNGDMVQGPGDIEFTGETLHGFERVTWASGQGFPYQGDEFHVLRDVSGEIVEIMNCSADGSVPNPTCNLDFKVEPLWVKLRFNKSDLDRLTLIRQHARRFARCILR